MAASPDGRWVATASYDRTVNLWDARTMKRVRTLHHRGQVWSVAFSADSRRLASGSSEIKVWDVETGKQIGDDLVGHHPTRLVFSLAFHPTRPWLASGSN